MHEGNAPTAPHRQATGWRRTCPRGQRRAARERSSSRLPELSARWRWGGAGGGSCVVHNTCLTRLLLFTTLRGGGHLVLWAFAWRPTGGGGSALRPENSGCLEKGCWGGGDRDPRKTQQKCKSDAASFRIQDSPGMYTIVLERIRKIGSL